MAAAVLLGLLALDRLDYLLFGGAAPPRKAALVLLALRFVMIEGLVQFADIPPPVSLTEDGAQIPHLMSEHTSPIDSFMLLPPINSVMLLLPINAMLAYVALPYVAARYFGATGAALCAVVVWVATLAHILTRLLALGWNQVVWAIGYYLMIVLPDVGYYLLLLTFATVIPVIVLAAQAGRVRAEGLLAELERSGWKRESYAEQALLLTEELNALARAIHEDLSRRLGAGSALLDVAPGFDGGEAPQAEQTVRAAKHEAAAALQDVRRSVRALRTAPAVPPLSTADVPPEEEIPPRRWRHWLVPQPFDAVVAAVYLSQVFLYVIERTAQSKLWTWPSLAMIGITLSLIALDRLELRLFGGTPPVKIAAALLVLRLIAVYMIAVATGSALWSNYFVLLIPYRSFVYFGSKIGFALVTLTAIGISAIRIADGPDWQEPIAVFAVYTLVVGVSLHMALAEWSGHERAAKLLRELRIELERLQASSSAALAAVQERNHLAREIHDGLGHYLTAINVQLEKALAFRVIDPPVADQAVREARRMTRAAQEEVHATLSALDNREEALTLAALVNQLVKNLASTQLVIVVLVEGTEEGFAKQSLVALYRAAQEGLTNVQKHAGPSRVRLELVFGPQEARLRLTDDGRGFDPAVTNVPKLDSGYGLQGLRERLELAGGRLEVASQTGEGTTLTVTVPRNPAVRAR